MQSFCNLLKSLVYKIRLVFFYGLIFVEIFAAAKSDNNARNSKNLKPEIVYDTEKSDEKILMLNAKDFEGLQDPAPFMWAPFVLPVQNLTVTNAALFIGGTSVSPPKEGACALFQSKPILSENKNELTIPIPETEDKAEKGNKKTYLFLNKTKQTRINTSLFFILSAQTHEHVAIGRLNSKGESRCVLPEASYLISTGYGRDRKEIHMDGKSKTITLNFGALSSVRVNPSAINNIQNGDIIRIGRKSNLEFTKKRTVLPESDLNFDNFNPQDEFKMPDFPEFHFPTRITPDLYTNADMISHDLSIDEYLRTSFLVGSMRYQIELEPGNYVIALLRKNKVVCLNSIALKPDSSEDLSCSSSRNDRSQEENAFQFEIDNTIFDVGFRPKRLLRNQDFVNWTLGTKGAILLGPPLFASESSTEVDTLNQDDFFSLVFKNPSGKTIYQTSYGASFSESIDTFKVPIVGMTQEQLFAGQVPFSEYVTASSRDFRVPYFLNLTNVQHTNGAEISIMEPVMTRTGVLFATNEQDFLVRIKVPQWNSTQVLEMYLDHTLLKRWLLKRGNISQTFSTIVKIKTYESKNFVVKFVARGESPLSNFLTGRDFFIPFAETREFCVSLDGKELCS